MSAAEINNYSSTLDPSSALIIALEQKGSSVAAGSNAQPQLAESSAKSFVVATAAPTLNKDPTGERFGILMQETLLEIINESDTSDFDAESFIAGFKEQMLKFGGASSSEESSSSEGFNGTTTSEANKNMALMAMMMNAAVTAASRVQLEQMKETQVASDKNIDMLISQRDMQDQNYDQQAQNAQKQKKIHRWARIGKWMAAGLMIAATAAISGPGAAAMAVAVMGAMKAMEKTGAMEAIQNINSPALRALAEVGVVVAITAAAVVGAGAIEGAAQAYKGAAEDVAEKAVKKGAITAGVAAASAALMSTGTIALYAQGMTNLIFTIGRLDKDSEASNRTKMAIQAYLTIALVVGTMATMGMMADGGSAGKTLLQQGLNIGTSVMNLATASTGIPEGLLGMDMAKLKEQAAYIQAGYDGALAASQASLSLGEQMQKDEREKIKSMQEIGNAALQELSDPVNAIARALQA